MKLSIIIPTYNCGQYIKKAIDSVLGQPYQNKEIIVIDGGSKDNTIEILKSYGAQIKWISEKDNGQADAINKGFKMATGDITTWLNADDYYMSNIFDEIVNAFEEDDKIVLVYGNCKSVAKNFEIMNTPPTQLNLKKMINSGNMVFQPSSFYRMKTIRAINYLDSSLTYWMEFDLFIKLLKNGSSKYINKTLSIFTLRDDQKSNSKNIVAMNKELRKISRLHGGHFFSRILISSIYNRLLHSIK